MEKRNTVQKQLVLDAVNQLACHPTAEEVYDFVVKQHPSVSKATVYRNLSSLAEDGRLRHISMPGAADRFDHCLQTHRHILCTECGMFMDAPVENGQDMDTAVAKATGFSHVTHDIVFHGLCPACAKERTKK